MPLKIDLDEIPYENKKISKSSNYISLVGESDKYISGTIVDSVGNVLSVPFIEKSSNEFIPGKPVYRKYFQGTHVKLWKNPEGEWMLSTYNNPEAENSHFMNPNEKFGQLFDEYGGTNFKDKIIYNKNDTHHFILVTKALTVTSKNQNLLDNECVIVYIGSTNLNGLRFELENNELLFCSTLDSNFPSKRILNNRIFYPGNISENVAEYIFSPFKDAKSIENDFVKDFFGENIMIINEDGTITKCVHPSYDRRYSSLGGTCIKKKLWDTLYTCKECYRGLWDTSFNIGTPDNYCIEFIKTLSSNENYYISLATYFCNHIRYEKSLDTEDKKFKSVLMYYIMMTPQEKVLELINYYYEYFIFEKELSNFIKRKGNIILHKRYTELFTKERLSSCESVEDFIKNFVKMYEKPLNRISDIYSRSRPNRMDKGYNVKFSQNIEKMVYREINLYKSYKMLKFLG